MTKALNNALYDMFSTIDNINKSVELMEAGPMALSKELKNSIADYRCFVDESSLRLYPWMDVYTQVCDDEKLTSDEQLFFLQLAISCENGASEYGRLVQTQYTISQNQYLSEQLDLTRESLLKVTIAEYLQRLKCRIHHHSDNAFDD